MFADLIKSSFPHDERAGLFCTPKLPAVKLGKILRKDTRIASPSDVVAMHVYSGTFSSGYLILTKTNGYYPKGDFLLEDVKEFQHKKDNCILFINQKGKLVQHRFNVKNEQVAQTLSSLFNEIAYYDPESEAMVERAAAEYEEAGYSATEIDWLNLRDEIMKTIDQLYHRYNNGKLSLLEYENKKEELLNRL